MLGMTKVDVGEISISPDVRANNHLTTEVVLHELLHALAHEWQLTELTNDSPEAETIVRALTTGLLQIIPQVEDWFIETRRATQA